MNWLNLWCGKSGWTERVPVCTGIIVFATFVVFGTLAPDAAAYLHCGEVLLGAWWRIATFPWWHGDAWHLMTNTVLFAALAGTWEREHGAASLLLLLAGASISTLIADCTFPVGGLGIRGLSAHGWACWGAWIWRTPVWPWRLSLILTAVIYGFWPWLATYLVGENLEVAVAAHLLCFCWGIGFAAVVSFRDSFAADSAA